MSTGEPRILLLIDPSSGFSANRAAEILATGIGDEFNTTSRTLGPRLITTVRQLRSGGADQGTIHAFGLRALTAAAFASRGPLIFTPDDESTARQLRWLRTIMKYRDVHVLPSSALQQRMLVASDIRSDSLHLIGPGVDGSRLRVQRNPDLRRALGFTDADRVMLLVGENTRASGHANALWAAAILHVLDPRYKTLAWRRGPRTASLHHFATSQRHMTLLTVAETKLARVVEFEELFAAADLALITPTAPVAPLPIAIAVASGLPIVGTASANVREFLTDGEDASLAPPHSPRSLAQRILEANEIPARSITAPREFDVARFIEQHREIYRAIIKQALSM